MGCPWRARAVCIGYPGAVHGKPVSSAWCGLGGCAWVVRGLSAGLSWVAPAAALGFSLSLLVMCRPCDVHRQPMRCHWLSVQHPWDVLVGCT